MCSDKIEKRTETNAGTCCHLASPKNLGIARTFRIVIVVSRIQVGNRQRKLRNRFALFSSFPARSNTIKQSISPSHFEFQKFIIIFLTTHQQ